jgi:hypothetical protein
MKRFSRIFGARRYSTPRPTDDEVAPVDVPRMLDHARDRGDRLSDNEIAAALQPGADVTAERHHDPVLRRRAAAASVAHRLHFGPNTPGRRRSSPRTLGSRRVARGGLRRLDVRGDRSGRLTRAPSRASGAQCRFGLP